MMTQGTREEGPRDPHVAHQTTHPAPQALQGHQDQEAQVATTPRMIYSAGSGDTSPQAHLAPRDHQGHQASKANRPETKTQTMAYPGNGFSSS